MERIIELSCRDSSSARAGWATGEDHRRRPNAVWQPWATIALRRTFAQAHALMDNVEPLSGLIIDGNSTKVTRSSSNRTSRTASGCAWRDSRSIFRLPVARDRFRPVFFVPTIFAP